MKRDKLLLLLLWRRVVIFLRLLMAPRVNLKEKKVYIEPCELRIVKKEKGRSCGVLEFPFGRRVALLLSFSHKIKICLYTKKKSGGDGSGGGGADSFLNKHNSILCVRTTTTTTTSRRIFLTIFFSRSFLGCLEKKKGFLSSSHEGDIQSLDRLPLLSFHFFCLLFIFIKEEKKLLFLASTAALPSPSLCNRKQM
jgi:hypothetical protein